jgi:hypothetical protein
MKSLKNLILLTFLLFGLTNCGTTLFTLTPDEESSLEMGRRIIEKENSFALSTLSFEDRTENEFILYLYAENKDEENFLLDPQKIFVKAYNQNKKQIQIPVLYAIDPEEQIYVLNKNIEERENTHDVVTGLNIVFSLLDTFVDLTDDDDYNNAEEVLENVVILSGNQIGEEIDYESDIDYLKSQKAYWKNEVLRRTELSKEENIGGIFYLPIIKEAKFIKIYVPLGKTIHTYKFEQITS